MASIAPEMARPNVVIDEELRSQVELDFQYDTFYDLSRSSGLSRQQVEDFTLLYSARSPRRTSGTYNPGKRLAKIFVPRLLVGIGSPDHHDVTDEYLSYLADQRVNGTTLHELGHDVDNGSKKKLLRQRQLIKTTVSVALGTAIAGNYENLAHNPDSGVGLVATTFTLGIGSYALARNFHREREAFANQFQAENSSYQIIRLTLSQATLDSLAKS